MIPTVSIIGRHNSGKTALIARLIPALAARGFRVGTAKHAPHLESLDKPGSDSAAHFRAGAHRVLLVGASASALFWKQDSADLPAAIDQTLGDCDIVLVEGGRAEAYPRIEVFRRAADLTEDPLAGEIDVAAVVTDDRIPLPDGVERIGTRNLERIADVIEAIAFGAAPAD